MDEKEMTAPKNGSLIVPFNSPIEIGLRVLFVLDELKPNRFSTQHLAYLDYALIHSGDFTEGPPSMHAPLPHRTSEWFLKRSVLEQGLSLGVERDLIVVYFDEKGIFYSASEFTTPFLQYFVTEYARQLRKRAIWVAANFSHLSETELGRIMTNHVTTWGADSLTPTSQRSKIFE